MGFHGLFPNFRSLHTVLMSPVFPALTRCMPLPADPCFRLRGGDDSFQGSCIVVIARASRCARDRQRAVPGGSRHRPLPRLRDRSRLWAGSPECAHQSCPGAGPQEGAAAVRGRLPRSSRPAPWHSRSLPLHDRACPLVLGVPRESRGGSGTRHGLWCRRKCCRATASDRWPAHACVPKLLHAARPLTHARQAACPVDGNRCR